MKHIENILVYNPRAYPGEEQGARALPQSNVVSQEVLVAKN